MRKIALSVFSTLVVSTAALASVPDPSTLKVWLPGHFQNNLKQSEAEALAQLIQESNPGLDVVIQYDHNFGTWSVSIAHNGDNAITAE